MKALLLIRFVILAAICFGCATPSFVRADDWPQFLGPNRDGVSNEKNLNFNWPKAGPPLLWKAKVGEGFSGPVVAGERLIIFHRIGDKEIVDCLNAATGKPIWQFDYATDYRDNYNKGNGPRSTPTIAGKNVITLGAGGWLHCIDLESGKKKWGRLLSKTYDIPDSFFGVGSSPLVEGDLVLLNVGGRKAGIVAFALATGKEVWRATEHEASYASPIAATVYGKRIGLFFTRFGVVLLDPKTGKVFYQKRWRARYNASVNAATPLLIDDLAFYSTSYETGALLLKIGRSAVQEIWSEDGIMSNHFNTCVYSKGHLYGIDGRQEGRPQLRCVELKTAKIKWTEKGFGCASVILVDGRVLALREDGDLVVFPATPTGFQVQTKATLLEQGPCRAQPALANGRYYARDQATLGCWKLKN